VQFSREGAVAAFYSVNESGFDRNAPAATNNGIEIIHEFLDLSGNPVTKVKVGEEFLVRLRLRATKRDRVPQIAVVDLLPGGTEAVLELRPPANSSTPGTDPAAARQVVNRASGLAVGLPDKSNWVPQHVDVRDDRLVLYGDIGKDAGTFVYRVRATNAGAFQAPPAFAEGLYSPQTTGIGPAGRLEIVKP
jgi:uncharacterized protein YfaS (alpha-2-macroglobulin family)